VSDKVVDIHLGNAGFSEDDSFSGSAFTTDTDETTST
jgi:hypothetical protein